MNPLTCHSHLTYLHSNPALIQNVSQIRSLQLQWVQDIPFKRYQACEDRWQDLQLPQQEEQELFHDEEKSS